MTTGDSPRSDRHDDGIVIVWALALVSILLISGVVGAVVIGQADLRMRAGSVADLAALAGAQAEQDPCAAAGAVVEANGLLLTACARDGRDVVVAVEARTPDSRRSVLEVLGADAASVRATARAGPP